MADKNYTVAKGDTLYGIARKHGVDVGDLKTADGGAVPEAIRPGDVVVVPGHAAGEQCAEEGCRAEGDDVMGKANEPDKKMLNSEMDDVNDDVAKAKDEKLHPASSCKKKKYVVVIDPGHGGKSYKDNKASSSWNNSVGVISNVLEKTMSHRLAKVLKKAIEAQAKKAAKCSVEVFLTKTDENVNISGKARAQIAKKRKADFFIVLHFNSYQRAALFKQHGVTKRKYDQSHIMDITGGLGGTKRDKPAGFQRRLFSSKSSIRGPQVVKRSNMPKNHPLIPTSVFASSVTKRVLAAIKKLDNSPNTKIKADHTLGVAVFSPKHLHKTGIACCYLEGDYINVESADRSWNPTQYAANIASVKPAKSTQYYKPKALPGAGKMDQAVADGIAAAIFAAINKPAKAAAKKGTKKK